MRSIPGLMDVIPDPDIQQFLRNATIPDADYFLQQLDVVDTAACSWLHLLEGISLNVFQGFATEEDLVDYFLHRAYQDNVTVFASKLMFK